MRVLVTGIYGFLGCHLGKALSDRGDFVVGLVRDYVGEVDVRRLPDVVVRGDFDQVERAIAEYECDTVFHLAAQTQVSVAASDPVGTLEANVRGTWQVLEACRKQKVRRVVVASSDKAYGNGCVPYQDEQSLRPHGVYATSKACADMLAEAYRREYAMSVAVTRCGNLYGPGHLNWSTLIPGTIRSVLRGEHPRLRSSGGPRRDYLCVLDAVDAYLKLADSDAIGPVNLGAAHFDEQRRGRGWSVREVVDQILLVLECGLAPIVDRVSGPGAGGQEIDVQVLDCSRAEAALGWRPAKSFGARLAETIGWYRNYLGVTRT